MVLPSRTKDRRLKQEPSDTKSSTLNDDPNRMMPKVDSELPKRAKLRVAIAEPQMTKSRALSEDPSFVKP
jgi:hypothetical protein